MFFVVVMLPIGFVVISSLLVASMVSLRAQPIATQENTCKWSKHKQIKKTSSTSQRVQNVLQIQTAKPLTEIHCNYP